MDRAQIGGQANKRFQQKAPPVCGMLGWQAIWGRRFS